LEHVDVSHIEYLKLYNFGEIFLHDNLDKILVQIPKQRWKTKHVEISTNGQCMDEGRIESVFRSGIITRFGVSADGDCTAEKYEELRRGAKWDRLIMFLLMVEQARRKHSPHTKIFLKVIPTGGKKEWKEFAAGIGWEIEWRKWRKAPESVAFDGVSRRVPKGPCKHVTSSRLRVYVDWDGTVVPCCNHPRAGVFGSLKSHKLSGILKGFSRKGVIREMKHNRRNMTICGQCEVK
jgi:hypothetical protein